MYRSRTSFFENSAKVHVSSTAIYGFMGFRVDESTLRNKVGCFPMVVVSILPHAEFGPNDHWEDAPHFILSNIPWNRLFVNK